VCDDISWSYAITVDPDDSGLIFNFTLKDLSVGGGEITINVTDTSIYGTYTLTLTAIVGGMYTH
jgi:hypothetical protein